MLLSIFKSCYSFYLQLQIPKKKSFICIFHIFTKKKLIFVSIVSQLVFYKSI